MTHPYTPLQNMIDATDRAEMHLERQGGARGWEQWEAETRAAIRRDRAEIAVIEAIWDRWESHCARLAGADDLGDADRRAKAVIDKAVAAGFPMARVDAIGNEIIEWTTQRR